MEFRYLVVGVFLCGCQEEQPSEMPELSQEKEVVGKESTSSQDGHVAKFLKEKVYDFFETEPTFDEVVAHFGPAYGSDPPHEGVTTSYFCSGDPEALKKKGPDEIGIYFLVHYDETGEVLNWAPTWIGGGLRFFTDGRDLVSGWKKIVECCLVRFFHSSKWKCSVRVTL